MFCVFSVRVCEMRVVYVFCVCCVCVFCVCVLSVCFVPVFCVCFKYISFSGLEKTLQNQTFKLSRPTEFNDPLDMHLQESLGEELEEFLPGLLNEFHRLIMGDRSLENLRDGPFREKIIIMQSNYGAASDTQKSQFVNALSVADINDIYDLKKLKARNKESVALILKAFRNDVVYCSTTDKENLLMWAHYADQHRGAVIEFTPNRDKDSVFLASKPVRYSKVRPLLYRDPADLLEHGLFMSTQESTKILIDNLVYTKSLDWEYEHEYRLYVPMEISEHETHSFLRFKAEELTAIYLGCRMSEERKKSVTRLAKKINNGVKLYNANMDARDYSLIFDRT